MKRTIVALIMSFALLVTYTNPAHAGPKNKETVTLVATDNYAVELSVQADYQLQWMPALLPSICSTDISMSEWPPTETGNSYNYFEPRITRYLFAYSMVN